MAGQLTIWGTTQRDIEPILKEIGIENVDVYNGSEPPIMTNGVLFVVGSQTIPKMANLGVVPKGRTITSLRVNTYELRTNKVRFSYSPSIKNIDSGMFTDLKNDLVLAYRLAMTGSLEPKLGHYKYVEDFSDYCNQLQVLEKDGKKNIPITFDTETIGFDYLHLGDNTRPQARFVSFQLSIKKGESHVVYFKDFGSMSQWLTKNASQLIYLFTDKNLSMGGANFKFDLNWLRHFTGLYCTNFKFDTTLVGSLLDENRSNSLDNHTKIYVPDLGGYADSFNATYDKGRMDLIPQDILLPYAGGDTDACFQVRQRMTLLLKEQPNLANFYINILHPSARAFEELEYHGVYIDRDRYFEVERDLNDEIKNCIHQAVKCIGGRLYAIHKDPKKVGGINIGKASLIEDYLFSPKGLNLKPKMLTEKTGKPVTSAQHLQMFLDVPEARPFIEAFLNYNKASKALSTYVTGFLKHKRSDGRFHPSYFLFVGDRANGDGGTSCLTGNQLVFTNRGYITVNEIKVGDLVISHTGKPRAIIDKFENGVKPIYRVTLSNGLILDTTGNHPYYVHGFEGIYTWVNADKLQVGNKVATYHDAEVWKPIEGWSDYEVSSIGRVRNVKTSKILKTYPKGKWGHRKLSLKRNTPKQRGEDYKDFSIHRLVAKAFLGEQSKLEVCHKNGIAWDNRAENLKYATSKENTQDAIRHGTALGRNIRDLKLSEEKVKFIRETTTEQGYSSTKLAERFGVSARHIRKIRKGDRWKEYELQEQSVEFKNAEVVSIELLEPEMTYGLTVDIDHSHVTNGIVTHNTGRLSCHAPAFQTLPKKGDWGKRLRKCFTAPEGYLVTEKDYSQGELRVIACVADEKTMLNAYKQGRDLHIQTGSGLGGITYEQMLALKDTDPDKFDSLRKNAKPANFGLCLHENSQVLTKNKVTNIIKTVRIADIQECHLVWDGVEWVSHDGIIYKGYHEVITYQGVTATPCHEVFTHELGKVTLYEATITNANIIETARGKTPITCGGDIYFESGDPSTDVEGNKRLVLRPRKRELLFLWGERDNRKLSRRKSLLNMGLFDLSVYGTPSDDVHIKKSKQAISTQQYESDKCKGKRKDPSRTLHRRLPKSISELEYVQSIAKLSSVQKRHLKKLGVQVYKAKVYDILNAGERHRFTADGKLVSNCYGMGANGYMTYAKNNYGVDMTLEEAEQIRHAFLYETYPMLPVYHERYKEIARKTGKIISPLGRVRHLPLINSRDSMVRSGAERQAVNSAIQSTLSDMLCWAMAISHQRGHTKYAPCFGAIHDATYNYVPEDDWEKWTLADKEIMETLPFEKVGWKPQLEFVADAKIGKSMGELYDLEDFKKEN